jgi:hypothetical protein
MKRTLSLLLVLVAVSFASAQKNKDPNLRQLRKKEVQSPTLRTSITPRHHAFAAPAHSTPTATAANQSLSRLEQQQKQVAARQAKPPRVVLPAEPKTSASANSQSLNSPPPRKKTGLTTTRQRNSKISIGSRSRFGR